VLPPPSSFPAHALPALRDGPLARRRPRGALLARSCTLTSGAAG
jgi:hypothetical protein